MGSAVGTHATNSNKLKITVNPFEIAFGIPTQIELKMKSRKNAR